MFASQTEPTWVSDLRSGTLSFKVESGNKILYRNYYVASLPQSELCDLAFHKTLEKVSAEIPDIFKIPTTLELMFYSENTCYITISVNKDYISSIKIITEYNKKVEVDWNKESSARLDAIRQKKKKRGYIAKNFLKIGLTIEEASAMIGEGLQLVAQKDCKSNFGTEVEEIIICWTISPGDIVRISEICINKKCGGESL